MDKPVRVLIVEDSEDDNELLLRELRKGGYNPTHERVETPAAMKAALAQREWDCIISDYSMPHFNGRDALSELQQSGIDIPFILVSGTIGEDIAVEAMKAGAHDYIMKDRLTRLVPALERELHEAETRQQRKRAGEALKASEERYRTLFQLAGDAILTVLPQDGTIIDANIASTQLLGYSKEELLKLPGRDIVAPECAEEVGRQWREQVKQKGSFLLETLWVRKDGLRVSVAVSGKPFDLKGQIQFQLIARDITERKQAETALRESENKYHIVADNTHDWEFWSDPEGQFIYTSPSCERITGYSADKFMADANLLGRLVHPDDLPGYNRHRREVRETPAPGETEFRILRPDGTWRWIEHVCQPVFDDEGRFQGTRGSNRDISERKRAELELRESEERFRRLAENAPDVVSRYELIPERRMSYISQAIISVAGYTPEEYYADPDFGFKIVHPDDQHIMASLTRGEISPEKPVFLRWVRKDGTVIWAEQRCVPIYDEAKNLVAIESISRDITERKQAEKKHAVLMTGIEQSQEIIAVMGVDTIIQYINPAVEKVTGYSQEELTGRSVIDFLVSENTGLIYTILDILKSGEVWKGKIGSIKKGGNEYKLETTISPVRDSTGTIFSSILVMRDITQETKIEERLLKAEKMEALGTLAGGIAHDFNNILSSIIGYSQLALDDTPKETLLHSNMQEVLQAGRRGRDLVKQILTFSRKSTIEKVPVQISSVVGETLGFLRPTIPANIEIRQNLESDSAVLADPTQIGQVLMNLCTNSVHAMSENGGILEVGLKDVELDDDFARDHSNANPGPYLKLSVSDTGQGIDKSIMGRIFEPFFTTKGKGVGTGMGLAVVHGIVKSLGGEITVYSTPGKGTVFNVFFPRIEGKVSAESDETTQIIIGRERIIFVDDEPQIVGLGKQMLERLGYHVVARTSPIEALETFRTQPDKFDLVISDVTMPHMTGDKLAIELRRIRPDIPIILCSGFSEQITEEKAKAIGVQAFLMKPLFKKAIAEAIRRALDQQKSGVTHGEYSNHRR